MTEIKFAWDAVGGDPALRSRVSTVVRRGALESKLPVRELARACVAACALAAAELGARRAGLPEVPAVRVDDAAVAAAFHSERLLRVDGRAPESFAPVSGTPLMPAAGLRVLDMTRVLAGPVDTRTLALVGAD
ncbi:hypothetical protein ACFW2E_42845, partial [Streptomyces sp. NPDC058964]